VRFARTFSALAHKRFLSPLAPLFPHKHASSGLKHSNVIHHYHPVSLSQVSQRAQSCCIVYCVRRARCASPALLLLCCPVHSHLLLIMSILNFVNIKRKDIDLLPSEEQTFRLLAGMQDELNVQYNIWSITKSKTIISNINNSLNIVRSLIRCYEVEKDKRFQQILMSIWKKDIRIMVRSFMCPKGSTEAQREEMAGKRNKVINDVKGILTNIIQDTDQYNIAALMGQLNIKSAAEVKQLVGEMIAQLDAFDVTHDLINPDLVINENPLVD